MKINTGDVKGNINATENNNTGNGSSSNTTITNNTVDSEKQKEPWYIKLLPVLFKLLKLWRATK